MSSDFAKKVKNNSATPLGVRFLRAFAEGANITDKREMAEKLGYKSDKVIYKIVNGEQEMGFENLLRFRELTHHPIGWLLHGDDWLPDQDEAIHFRFLLGNLSRNTLEDLWRTETKGNIDFKTYLSLLLERGVEATRFGSAASMEDRIRQIVRQEMAHKDMPVADQAEENVQIKPVSSNDVILAPVIANISGEDPKDQVRGMLVSDEQIEQIQRQLKPRKRKTG